MARLLCMVMAMEMFMGEGVMATSVLTMAMLTAMGDTTTMAMLIAMLVALLMAMPLVHIVQRSSHRLDSTDIVVQRSSYRLDSKHKCCAAVFLPLWSCSGLSTA